MPVSSPLYAFCDDVGPVEVVLADMEALPCEDSIIHAAVHAEDSSKYEPSLTAIHVPSLILCTISCM